MQLDAPSSRPCAAVLRNPTLDAAFKELVLTLPSESYIAEQLDEVDPQRIHAVRESMRLQLAQALAADWEWAFEAHQVKRRLYARSAVFRAARAGGPGAGATCAWPRGVAADPVWPGRAYQRFKDAGNMTDRFGALSALVGSHAELAEPALQRFHELFKDEALVHRQVVRAAGRRAGADGKVLPRESGSCCSTPTSRCATRTARAA